jgi:hypothetical protein
LALALLGAHPLQASTDYCKYTDKIFKTIDSGVAVGSLMPTDLLRKHLQVSENALYESYQIFDVFLTNTAQHYGVEVTPEQIAEYISNNSKTLGLSEDQTAIAVWFFQTIRFPWNFRSGFEIFGHFGLPGELTPNMLLGVLEIGAGVALGLTFGWTGAGAAIAGGLIGDGVSNLVSDVSQRLDPNSQLNQQIREEWKTLNE